MMRVTITHAPGATTPEDCADGVPLLVATVDRATCAAILAVVARAIVERVETESRVEEWEPAAPKA